MHVPRPLLLTLWALLTLAAYYLMWFTPWGEFAPQATQGQTILVESTMVFASVASAEVMRSEKLVALRAVAGAVGFPLVVVTLWTLWYGVRRHLALG